MNSLLIQNYGQQKSHVEEIIETNYIVCAKFN